MENRWEFLFADLDAQLDAAEAAEFDEEVRERVLIEAARVGLRDRLRAARGRQVTACCQGADPIAGRVTWVGADWVLLVDGAVEFVVPLAAVRWLAGDGVWSPSAPPDGSPAGVAARLGLGHALRELGRRRAPVAVFDIAGGRIHGFVEQVGADYLVVGERLVPFGAIGLVRSA